MSQHIIVDYEKRNGMGGILRGSQGNNIIDTRFSAGRDDLPN